MYGRERPNGLIGCIGGRRRAHSEYVATAELIVIRSSAEHSLAARNGARDTREIQFSRILLEYLFFVYITLSFPTWSPLFIYRAGKYNVEFCARNLLFSSIQAIVIQPAKAKRRHESHRIESVCAGHTRSPNLFLIGCVYFIVSSSPCSFPFSLSVRPSPTTKIEEKNHLFLRARLLYDVDISTCALQQSQQSRHTWSR